MLKNVLANIWFYLLFFLIGAGLSGCSTLEGIEGKSRLLTVKPNFSLHAVNTQQAEKWATENTGRPGARLYVIRSGNWRKTAETMQALGVDAPWIKDGLGE